MPEFDLTQPVTPLELAALCDCVSPVPEMHAIARRAAFQLDSLTRLHAALQSLVQPLSDRAEMADQYERWLEDIGKQVGCGHVDEQLPNCVNHELERLRSR